MLKNNKIMRQKITESRIFFLFRNRVVSMAFMRKYIHVARNIRPALTREAAEHLADEYSKLRNQEMGGTQSMIARVSGHLRVLT